MQLNITLLTGLIMEQKPDVQGCPCCKKKVKKSLHPIVFNGVECYFLCSDCKKEYILCVYHEPVTLADKLCKLGMSRPTFYRHLKEIPFYKIESDALKMDAHKNIIKLHKEGFSQSDIFEKTGYSKRLIRKSLNHLFRDTNKNKKLEIILPWNLWETLHEKVPKVLLSEYVSKSIQLCLRHHPYVNLLSSICDHP